MWRAAVQSVGDSVEEDHSGVRRVQWCVSSRAWSTQRGEGGKGVRAGGESREQEGDGECRSVRAVLYTVVVPGTLAVHRNTELHTALSCPTWPQCPSNIRGRFHALVPGQRKRGQCAHEKCIFRARSVVVSMVSHVQMMGHLMDERALDPARSSSPGQRRSLCNIAESELRRLHMFSVFRGTSGCGGGVSAFKGVYGTRCTFHSDKARVSVPRRTRSSPSKRNTAFRVLSQFPLVSARNWTQIHQ